jgi:streptogramin lyase
MAVGPDGRVFVRDLQTPAIWLYDATGRVVRRVGRAGAGPGEYDRINGIAVRPDGHLIAWDAGNARLNVYDPAGEFVTSWRLPITGTYMSNAVTADTQNRVWLNASPRLVYDALGALVDSVAVPDYSTDTPVLRARREGMSQSRVVPYATFARSAVSPLGFIIS